jgi:hypothetical protein
MKKIILSILSISFFSTACNITKTTIVPEVKTGITVRTANDKISFNRHEYHIANGMLVFSTFAEYEELFDVENPSELDKFAKDVENSTAIVTYSTQLTQAEKQELHFISSIINEQGMIKIDVFTLLLNFKDKVIYVTRYGTTNDLISANNGNTPTNVFQLNMEGGETIDALLETKTRGFLCKESYADQKTIISDPMKTYLTEWMTSNHISLYAKLRYESYGIFYELFSQSWASPQYTSGMTFNPQKTLTTVYWWQRRCSSASGSGTSVMSNNYCVGTATSYSDKYFIYGNAKALKHYNVTATIKSTNSLIYNDSKTININDL